MRRRRHILSSRRSTAVSTGAGAAAFAALTLVAAPLGAGTAQATPTPPPRPRAATPTTPPPVAPPTLPPGLTEPVGGARLSGTGLLLDVPRGVPAPPAFDAPAWVLAEATTGKVVAAKAPHATSRPASTLKTLTALTLAPRLSPRQVVVGAAEDAAVEGTKVGMLPGQSYTVEQLFQGLLLSSGNDAAIALARANGGLPTTARQMNETARHLGALDTRAANTSGLDAVGQVTSAYDLALIGRAALADPTVARYVATKTAVFPGKRLRGPGNHRQSFQVGNHNKLMFNYAGTIGVKNGYTDAARHTYIGAARRGTQTYVITFLARPTSDWRPTATLLDWAFAHGPRAKAVGVLVEPGEVEAGITGATQPAAPEVAASKAADAVADAGDRAAGTLRADPRWAGAAAAAGLVVLGLGVGIIRRRKT